MNSFEFKKAMENFDWEEYTGISDNISEDIRCIKNLKVYHDCYYTVVSGLIPYRLANKIYKKYDNKIFHIRVDGSYDINKKAEGNVYRYHIDTLEGLIAVLLETRNYYDGKNTRNSEFNEMLRKTYIEMLKLSNLSTVYDWVWSSTKYKSFFDNILSEKTQLDFKLRKKIEAFDKAITPFANGANIENNKFKVHVWPVKSLTLTPQDQSLVYSINYNEDGWFLLQVSYQTDFDTEYSITHSFNGWFEEIIYSVKNDHIDNAFKYNLTSKSLRIFNNCKLNEVYNISVDYKKFIIDRLDYFINKIEDTNQQNITNYKKKLLK